jgi:hypothetical protein
MINRYAGTNSSEKAASLRFFVGEAVQHGIRIDFQRVTGLAKVDINKMDLAGLQNAIKVYLKSYWNSRDYVAKFAKATGLDANADGLMDQWNKDNARALNSFDELKTNPTANGLTDVSDSLLRMPDGKWWLP